MTYQEKLAFLRRYRDAQRTMRRKTPGFSRGECQRWIDTKRPMDWRY